MPLKISSSTGDNTTSTTHGLEQANRLVQSIFNQITEGDAPSSNFEFNNNLQQLHVV